MRRRRRNDPALEYVKLSKRVNDRRHLTRAMHLLATANSLREPSVRLGGGKQTCKKRQVSKARFLYELWILASVAIALRLHEGWGLEGL